MYTHPSVYIDDNGVWHENYWYLAFSNRFDCWDHDKSKVSKTVVDLGGEKFYQIYTYRLYSNLSDKTPLHDRLLFKMGGTVDPFLVCHESLRHLFSAEDAGGCLRAVADY